MSSFIIEGGNATGKSSLLETLEQTFPDYQCRYSVDPSFNSLRKLTYNQWSDQASLYYYLAGNLQTLSEFSDEPVFFDRSLFSTFAMYLARQDEAVWLDFLPLFSHVLSQIPAVSGVIHLTASNEVRLARINSKEGEAKESDLAELRWEDKKQRAREFLLQHAGLEALTIDTSNLALEDVATLAIQFIRKQKHRSVPVLKVLMGLPGCGKSTFCRSLEGDGFKVLSTDEIREQHYGTVFSDKIREKVWRRLLGSSVRHLKQGHSVILDTTYLNAQEERCRFIASVKAMVENVHIKAYAFPADIQESIRRDQLRPVSRRVGETVIRQLSSQYVLATTEEGFDAVIAMDNVSTEKAV